MLPLFFIFTRIYLFLNETLVCFEINSHVELQVYLWFFSNFESNVLTKIKISVN